MKRWLATLLLVLLICMSSYAQPKCVTGFDRYMAKIRKLAPRYGYRVPKNDESWEEWFWLYYYLDGVSPRQAVISSARVDKLRHRKAGK